MAMALEILSWAFMVGGLFFVIVGSIGTANVFSECHEGAIYLHRGRSYRVTRLSMDDRAVHVEPADVPYYTRALS